MTIDEAIKILTKYTSGGNPWSLTELTEASILGIEALKRVQELRPYHDPEPTWLLPGETEEVK